MSDKFTCPSCGRRIKEINVWCPLCGTMVKKMKNKDLYVVCFLSGFISGEFFDNPFEGILVALGVAFIYLQIKFAIEERRLKLKP